MHNVMYTHLYAHLDSECLSLSYSVSVAINDVLQTVGTAKKSTIGLGLHNSNRGNESGKSAVVQEFDSGDMQSGDIARYIQTHDTKKDDDLDLF